jgi:hypothetical protein
MIMGGCETSGSSYSVLRSELCVIVNNDHYPLNLEGFPKVLKEQMERHYQKKIPKKNYGLINRLQELAVNLLGW